MSTLKDVIDVIKDVRSGTGSLKNAKLQSLSRLSSDSILQFPVIVPREGMSLDDVIIITKALERQYTTFVRMAMSLDNVVYDKDISSVKDYINKFHQNVDTKGIDSGTLFDVGAKIMTENTNENIFLRDVRKLDEGYKYIKNPTLLSSQVMKNIEDCFEYDEEFEDELSENINATVYTYTKLPVKYVGKVNDYLKGLSENHSLYKVNGEIVLIDESSRISHLKFVEEDDTLTIYKSKYHSFVETTIDFNNLDRSLKGLNEGLLKPYEIEFRTDILNEKTLHSNNFILDSKNKELNRIYNLNEESGLDREKFNYQRSRDAKKDEYEDAKFAYQKERDAKKDEYEDAKFFQKDQELAHNAEKEERQRIDSSRREARNNNNRTIYTDNLMDNDVKKANELIPTTLHLRVIFRKENGEDTSTDFVIGVKTVCHPVSSEEMITNIVRGIKRNRDFFNFIRWTSGEISFFKDFLFTIDEIKTDVKNKFSGGSAWWTAFQRRKTLGKLKRSLFLKNQLLPNATLVVTAEEVDIIKNEYGINLKDVGIVNEIMKEYFLLGFVIADTSSEVAYFLFDGQSDYQTYPFSALERENGNKAKDIKNIMTVLGKM